MSAGTAAHAEDTNKTDLDSVIGFEFGVNYHLFNDRRFTGTDASFALVIPFKDAMDVLVYHESGAYQGKDTAGAGAPQLTTNVQADINELKFRVKVWGNGNQAVKFQVGAGYGTFGFDMLGGAAGTDNVSALVADIGASVTAMTVANGPIKGTVNMQANYRYTSFTPQAIFGAPMFTVKDFSNFNIGLGVGLYF